MKKLIPASLTLALLSACGSNDSSPSASTAGLRPASGASAVLGQPLTPPLEPGYENLPDDIRPPPRRQVVIDLTSVYKPAGNGKPMRFNMGQLTSPAEHSYNRLPEPFEHEKREQLTALTASNRERTNRDLAPLGDGGKNGRYLEAEAARQALVMDEWRGQRNEIYRAKSIQEHIRALKNQGFSFQTAYGYQMTEEQARQQWANDPEAQKELLDRNAVAMGIGVYTNPQTGERTWVRLINHNPQFRYEHSLMLAGWHSMPPLEFGKRISWNGNEEINLTLNELMKHGGDPEKGDVFSLDGDKRKIPEKEKSKAQVVVYGSGNGVHMVFDSKDQHLPENYRKTERNLWIVNPAGVDYKGRPYNWRYQTIGSAWIDVIWPAGAANHFNIGRATGYPSPDFRATYRGVAEGAWGTMPVYGDVEAKVFDKKMDLTVSNLTDGRIFQGPTSFSDQLKWNSENQRFEGDIPGNNAAFYGPNGAEIGGQFNRPGAREGDGLGHWSDIYYHGAYGAVRVE